MASAIDLGPPYWILHPVSCHTPEAKPSTLDPIIEYFTPSHVIHQRLLLQFLSAPEDGCKKRPKHVQLYCSD